MQTKTCSPIRSSTGLDMHVLNVMTKDVLSIQKYESIMHVAQILSQRNISGLPVVDKESHVIGIITQADILSIMGIRKENTFKDLLKHILGEPLREYKMGDFVGDVMTSPAVTVKPQANIVEVVRLMDEKNIRRLPVVDDNNVLVGIISRADILKSIIKKLT